MKKGSLAHGQTWFGRPSYCFVIYVNLHKLPCILYASKWLRRYVFFTSLWLLGFKLKKRNLEHGKTWLGRRSSCFVTCVNLHKLPCMCIKTAAAVFFFIYTFLLIIAMQDETRGKRSTWQNLEGVSVVW